MEILQPTAAQRFVLSGIDWDTYLCFSDLLGERNIRFNYKDGELEFMTLSPEHQRAKHLLALFLGVVSMEMEIDIAGFGSMTCRREDLERGFEPDECYWIAHEAQMRGRKEIDLSRDPPPDLLLEVEISRTFVNRLAIAAGLGVPEIWRYDGQTIHIMLLNAEGKYVESPRSQAFPFFPVAELVRFLHQDANQSETQLLRAFRTWVREQMARGWTSAAD
jgi:Uma2 family endonuclease